MPTRRARKTSKRTVIEPKGHRRYVRRSKTDQFEKEVNVGRSLAANRRPKKAKSQRRHADRGDTKRSGGGGKAVVRKLTGG